MAVALGPNPHWVVIDNFSKLPPGAVIYTYNFLNPTQYQPAFEDAAGTIPFPQPIPEWGSGNGTFPPIYWLVDTPYYIQVWTGNKNADGSVMLWDFSGILSSSSGGGGPTIVTNNVIENLVINGTFFRPLGIIGNPGTPLATSQLMILAPSNNAGYVDNPANVATTGYTGPDIAFAKSNSAATDSISFNEFIPTGVEEFLPDVTPPYFVNYTCTVPGGETYKYFQFPISNGIVNLSGQTVTVRLWANSQSGSQDVRLVIRQFYGDGSNSPSADIPTIVGGGPLIFNAFNEWQLFTFTATLPTTTGTVGNCGNDATFLQIQMPLSDATSFSFIKPGVFLTPGTALNVQIDYHTNDYIDSIVSTPRTGDIRTSLNAFSPYGWVIMDDGTIGNSSSNATSRANIDTFPLFDLIWRTFKGGGETLAPMFESTGIPVVGYGTSPVADFTVNRQISLTKAAGRLLANVGLPGTNSVPVMGGSNTGTTWAIGQTTGNELHTQSIAEMPNHNHPGSTVPFANVAASRGGGAADTVLAPGPGVVTVAPQGGGSAFNVQQPVSFLNVFIKL